MTKNCESRFVNTPLFKLPYPTFCLNQSPIAEIDSKPKTLIILFVWLTARERHIDKFRQLYLDKGYDVLSVRAIVTDALIPAFGSKIKSRQLFEFLSEQYHHYDSIMFHSFSIGSYLMAELLLLLEEKKNNCTKINHRMRGLIFDSPVDIEWIGIGLANTFAMNSSLLQWIIIKLNKVHFFLFRHIAVKHYIAASAIVHKNPHNYPTVLFFSKDDDSSDWGHMSRLMDGWTQGGTRLWVKCWDESLHACHYYKHPQEYTELLDDFLDEINKSQNVNLD